nr:hypothetical protein CFP56_50277 [Quercus suber]
MQDMAAMETTSLPVHEANLELMVNDEVVEHAKQFIPLPSHVREKFYALWKSSVIVKNQFSNLADLSGESLDSANYECLSLMHTFCIASTSDALTHRWPHLTSLVSLLHAQLPLYLILRVRLPSTLTHLPLQTFLPVTMMDHPPHLPHSLDFDLPPSSPFHHPQNSSSNTLNPDTQPFYSLALVDYLTFHMSLIHPPNSPQPIQILQVALHPTTPIQ